MQESYRSILGRFDVKTNSRTASILSRKRSSHSHPSDLQNSKVELAQCVMFTFVRRVRHNCQLSAALSILRHSANIWTTCFSGVSHKGLEKGFTQAWILQIGLPKTGYFLLLSTKFRRSTFNLQVWSRRVIRVSQLIWATSLSGKLSLI